MNIELIVCLIFISLLTVSIAKIFASTNKHKLDINSLEDEFSVYSDIYESTKQQRQSLQNSSFNFNTYVGSSDKPSASMIYIPSYVSEIEISGKHGDVFKITDDMFDAMKLQSMASEMKVGKPSYIEQINCSYCMSKLRNEDYCTQCGAPV